jgi:4-hydroxy-tetrahydrodipicolinate synthase
MIQTRLKGMGVALITPFKEDDSVDYDALLRLVDYQLQNGTDFLCVLGTTAETPTLTKEEKDKIKRLIIERMDVFLFCWGLAVTVPVLLWKR